MRTLLIDGEPWFVVADAARILGYRDAGNASRLLRPQQQGYSDVSTPSGTQTMLITNEGGMNRLLMRSNTERAEAVQDWFTDEVLPAIRRTGSYAAPETPEQLMARALVTAQGMLEQKSEQIEALTPRADAWDAIASAKGDYSVGDAAKMLARAGIPTGPTRLFGQLAAIKWTYRAADGKPRAYADRVEKGFLSEKPQFHYHPKSGERVVDAPQVRVTIKGLDRLRLRLHDGARAAVSS
ncbi:phage antirepressor KilAC domain-containing protein [Cryobacterium sp. PH31-AA6]|uniref:phage antirepressor KilAC domain-containing protein n=1 Tax=Cryobacterium sp. PH31-AA6 TaxID=3046205 RepID=UPI0024BA84F2|nr:phage antirepressor KilAC domain-containing protein [Cryobacterium sp. PH31-AA6]MDJ0323205.1 phage antirepressor KilAC domain-containing protein [Cryobacterium sp. PH31-AA6]